MEAINNATGVTKEEKKVQILTGVVDMDWDEMKPKSGPFHKVKEFLGLSHNLEQAEKWRRKRTILAKRQGEKKFCHRCENWRCGYARSYSPSIFACYETILPQEIVYDNIMHEDGQLHKWKFPTTNVQYNDTDIKFWSASRCEEFRLLTFYNWNYDTVSAEDLAQDGFLSLQDEDKVICRYCSGMIGSWEDGDDVVTEHDLHYPHCRKEIKVIKQVEVMPDKYICQGNEVESLEKSHRRQIIAMRTLHRKHVTKVTRQLSKQITKMKIEQRELKTEKWQPQMLTELFGLPHKASSTLDKISDVASSALPSVDRLGKLTTAMEDLAEKVSTFLKGAVGDVDWTDVVEMATLLKLAIDHMSLPLAMLCVSKIVKILQLDISIFHSIYQYCVKNYPVAEAQGLEVLCDLKNFFCCITSVIALIFRGKDVDYQSLTNSLSDFGRAAIGFTKLQDFVTYVVKFVQDQYNYYIHGMTADQVKLCASYGDLDDLYHRTRTLLEIPTCYFDSSKLLCEEMIKVYTKWENFRHKAAVARDISNVPIFAAMVAKCSKKYEAATNSPIMVVTTRKLPIYLYMYGKPGTGKTILSNALQAHLWKEFGQEKGIPITDMSYNRKVENEYWDGYRHQLVLCYDDLLQQVDTVSKPNMEYMEIIRVVNEDNFQLHMADLCDKKNTFFDSEFVISTSNMKIPRPVSIASPGAFCRRIHLAIEVKVKPEFADGRGKIDKAKFEQYIADHDLEGTYQTFHYMIDIYDPSNGEVIRSDLTYDEFLEDYTCKIYDVRQTATNLRRDMLKMAGIEVKECSEKIHQWEQALMETPTVEKSSPEEVAKRLQEIPLVGKFVSDKYNAYKAQGTEEFLPLDTCYNEIERVAQEVESEDEEFSDATEVQDSFLQQFVVKMKKNTILENIKKNVVKTAELSTIVLKHFGNCVRKICPENILTKIIGVVFFSFASITIQVVIELISKLFLKLGFGFGNKECRVNAVQNFEDLKRYVPCQRFYKDKTDSCLCTEFYDATKDLEEDRELRAHGLARSISFAFTKNNPELANKFMRISLHQYRIESNEARTLRSVHRMVAESNTTVTNAPRNRMVAESNVTQTRNAKGRIMAESNATMTRRPGTKLRAEDLGPIETYPKNVEVSEITTMYDLYHNDELQAQMNDTVQLEQLGKVVYGNMVSVKSEAGTMNALFVTGSILMIPSHFFARKDIIKTLSLTNPYQSSGTTISIDECKIHQCTDLGGCNIDLVLVELPRCVPSRPNILKYFSCASQFNHLVEGEIVVACFREHNRRTVLNTYTTPKFKLTGATYYTDCRDISYYANRTISYDISTQSGDCGSPVFAKNNSIRNKIVGVHVAGRKGDGLALTVSSELLSRNLQAMNPSNRSVIDGRVPFSTEMREVSVIPNFNNDMLEMGDCLSLGKLQSPHTATKSKINESLIHGEVVEPTMKRAYLRNVVIDGEVVNPLKKGITKVLGIQAVIPKSDLHIAVNDVERMLESKDTRKVYTYAEAVAGIDGEFDGINRRTSAGYPYNLDLVRQGKRQWFGDDEYIINEEVKKDVDQLLDNCKQGKRGDVVFIATLKDERRPIAKANQGKTRVFEAAPMHFVIAFRMFFLAFINSVSNNRITNEIAVGTNVYSRDWDKIGQKMRRFSDKVIAGDFSNFDGSLNQEILWSICDIVNNWYDDGEENKRIREVLWEEVCNTNVLVDGQLIRQTHSQPSGNPMTVIINSIFNQIVMRMAYIDCKREAGLGITCDFTNNVSFVTYGDDNLLNVSDDAIEWYNQITITDSLSKIGLTYTDEAKSEVLISHRDLADVEFLKRRFVMNGYGIFEAPLRLDVVLEMSNWIKGNDRKAATVENVETSLRELAIHGEQTYNHWSQKLQKACYNKELKPRIPTYIELRSDLDKELW